MFRPKFWQIPAIDPSAQASLSQKTALLAKRLQEIAAQYPHAIFASSLAVEDMIITDQIAKLNLAINVITLNTGKLNAETELLINKTQAHYPHLSFDIFYPIEESAQSFEQENGVGAMYKSVELRKSCCFIRKIEPLNRALNGANAWLTGQRRSQSVTRSELHFEELDTARNIAKFNPIFDWEEADVWAYVLSHDVPLNDLYHQGYPSIGCEPCTVPVKEGEDIRSGRWSWENKDSKECGLHQT